MKFFIAKNDDNLCQNPLCGNNILRGDDMVGVFIIRPGFRKMLFFHIQCVVPWYGEYFRQKWEAWKGGPGHKRRVGRPVQYTDPDKATQLNRLRSALSYHKKLGHKVRIKYLENKIKCIL